MKPAVCGLFCVLLNMMTTVSASSRIEYYNHFNDEKDLSDVSFKFYSYDYKVTLDDGHTSFGKSSFIGYKAQNIDDLENYIVVQFIRGCQYSSDKNSSWISRHRRSFGKLMPYQYMELSIDSVDTDPAFKSDQTPRHGLYRWNNKGIFSHDGLYVRDHTPESNFLYYRHSPGTAFLSSGVAQNISLEYKSCLLKSKDVPLHIVDVSDLLADALHCFDWSYSRIYDFKDSSFKDKSSISPFCLK